jgi:hypothetical protein
LPEAFCKHFADTLKQHVPPKPAAVLCWLKQQLRIQATSYGSDSGADSGMDTGDDEATVPHSATAVRGQGGQPGQQQGPKQRRRTPTQQQQQQSPPRRRSERSTAGRMSAGYAAIYGPAGGAQGDGHTGKGTSQQASTAGTMPLTPAVTHQPRRAKKGAQGRL